MSSDSRNDSRCASFRLLTTLTIISIALLVILACGYAIDAGPVLRHNSSGAPRDYFEIFAHMQRGRVVFWEQRGQTPIAPPFQGWELTWRGSLFHVYLPDVKRSLWEFDDHWIGQSNAGYHIFACPIWCLALPCVIAPVLWLRQRRRADAPGFPVHEQPAAAASAV